MSSRTRIRYGVRTRLRDDACDRELERLPDAKRAVYLAVDAMLKADEKRRVLDARLWCGGRGAARGHDNCFVLFFRSRFSVAVFLLQSAHAASFITVPSSL